MIQIATLCSCYCRSVRQVRDVASLMHQLKEFSWTRSRHNEKHLGTKGGNIGHFLREPSTSTGLLVVYEVPG